MKDMATGVDQGRDITPIVGPGDKMRNLVQLIATVARRPCTVLVHGETGTGKELVARHVHAHSGRAHGPFVPVDCAAVPESVFESQMFGHVRGAFTGAQVSTTGFIRAAHGGTLLLDEVGELTLPTQAKLLRVLQERVVTPVGSVQRHPVDFRVVAATHRDLWAMVLKGTFREDLYFRLNIARLTTIPLRQRMGDLPALVAHFLDDIARLFNEPRRRVSEQAMDLLRRHSWPGNIRELRNVLEGAVAMTDDPVLTPRHLPQSLRASATTDAGEASEIPTLDVAERRLILKALRAAGGNQSEAARMLGVGRQRLRRRLERYATHGEFDTSQGS